MVNPRPDNASTRRAIMGCAVLVGLFLCVTSIAVAQDSHYWTNQYGTRAQLLGGLVVGSFVDLSSTYYNPGTMALVSDRGVLLTTNAFQLVDIEFDDLLGSGLDISQQRVRPAPSMFATDLPFSGLGDHKLAISVLTRRNFVFETSEQRADDTGVGEAEVRMGVLETWVGPTWAFRLNERIGFGATGYFAVRSQKNRVRLSVQSRHMSGELSRDTVSDFQYWHLRALAKLGLGFNLDPWVIGLTVTTPGLNLAGSGEVFSNLALVSSDPSQESIIEGGTQQDLSAEYRSPVSIALGASRQLGDFRVFVTAEYFESVDPYAVIEPYEFVGQTSGDTIVVALKRAENSVLNWGFGLEFVLGGRSELYAAFYVDDSSFEPIADSMPVAIASWDVLNFNFGGAISVGDADFTAGVSIGFGSDEFEQLVNLSGEGVSRRGVKYRSIGLFLGIGVSL